MTRFQLVFRRDGQRDQTEDYFSDHAREPRIDGRPVVHGQTYVIRGGEWLLQREESPTGMTRFVCTLLAESPAAEL